MPNKIRKGKVIVSPPKMKLSGDPKKDLKIYYWGSFTDFGGYALANRHFAKHLINEGYDTSLAIIPTSQDISVEEFLYYKKHEIDKCKDAGLINRKKIRIIGHTPISGVMKDCINVGYTMIETRKPNVLFVRNLNGFYNHCITPTEYYKRKMEEAGVKIPIDVVPIGVDRRYISQMVCRNAPNFNYKILTNQRAPEKPEGHRFLSVFRWNFRKGPDVLIKSFLKEFKASDNVSLVLFTKNMEHRQSSAYKFHIVSNISDLYKQYGSVDSPPIYLCEDKIHSDHMPTMYDQGDTFALPSRGEGQCLPALEASAMGLPVILPNITAFQDYCTKDNCWLFEPDEYVKYEDMPEWYIGDVKIGEYIGEEFPKYGNSIIEEVGSLMRKAMENPEESKRKNESMRQVILDRYQWSTCSEQFEEKIRGFC